MIAAHGLNDLIEPHGMHRRGRDASRRKLGAVRIQQQQIDAIKIAVARVAGADAQVRLFGSRLDDQARGGDIDLLVELPHPADRPVWLEARVAAAVELALGGRKVDVLLSAPGIKDLPVHRWARATGQAL